MTTNQENKLQMYQTVERYLLTHAETVRTLPNYESSFAAMQHCVRQINVHKQVQEVNSTGVAEQKQQRKEALLQAAMEMVSKLKAYATFSGQTVLLREIDFSESNLRQASVSVLTDRARIILSRAQEHAAALAEYRLQPEQLTALQTDVDSFVATIPDPRLSTMTRKSATDILKNCYAEVDVLLKEKIDIVVAILRSSHQDARTIVDRNTRRKEAKTEVAA